MVHDGDMADMTTLSNVTAIASERGFKENFKVTPEGLYAASNNIAYLPNEVKIDNFYRFEGASNPDDNAILYLLETHDGLRGTLTDAYGATADGMIAEFISRIPVLPKAPGNDDYNDPDWR